MPPVPPATLEDYILILALPDLTAGAVFRHQLTGTFGPGYYYPDAGSPYFHFFTTPVVQSSYFFERTLKVAFAKLPAEVLREIELSEYKIISAFQKRAVLD